MQKRWTISSLKQKPLFINWRPSHLLTFIYCDSLEQNNECTRTQAARAQPRTCEGPADSQRDSRYRGQIYRQLPGARRVEGSLPSPAKQHGQASAHLRVLWYLLPHAILTGQRKPVQNVPCPALSRWQDWQLHSRDPANTAPSIALRIDGAGCSGEDRSGATALIPTPQSTRHL